MDYGTGVCGGGADHYGKGLLTPEVSRPFWWGEGIKKLLEGRIKSKNGLTRP